MEKQKITPKIPPNHNYCPICGDRASYGTGTLAPTADCTELSMRKYCNRCGATWTVRYYLKPKAITNICVSTEYEDISL